MKKGKINKKIVVAMSGGVDSSVAAALLKKQGYDVIGVFMKFWFQRCSKAECGASQNKCCSTDAEKRARKVAEILGIPFYVFNFEKEFKKRVVDYFLREEKAGSTPNPCVVCNKEIKFGLLLKKALAFNADFIATGHYARVVDDCHQQNHQRIFRLYKGKDKNKDQSYFLWKLSQKQLSRVLFPVGNYTKTQVRKLAKKFKLPTADTPESQEICFVQTTVNAFLAKHINPKPGKIIDIKGNILGEHQGLWFYTIGQRKGIGLSRGPFYVLDKDIKRNFLIVTQNERDLYKKELTARNISWILGKAPKFPIKVSVKIRYRHNSAPALLLKNKSGGIRIFFLKQQKAITPGQSAVFYVPIRSSQAEEGKGNELLGGGIIE